MSQLLTNVNSHSSRCEFLFQTIPWPCTQLIANIRQSRLATDSANISNSTDEDEKCRPTVHLTYLLYCTVLLVSTPLLLPIACYKMTTMPC